MEQPLCLICHTNPTNMTLEIDATNGAWQDVWASRGEKATIDGAQVNSIVVSNKLNDTAPES